MSRKMGTGSLGVEDGRGAIKNSKLKEKLKDNEGED